MHSILPAHPPSFPPLPTSQWKCLYLSGLLQTEASVGHLTALFHHTNTRPYYSTLTVCKRLLASGGYFMKKGEYYCSGDYHSQYGTKCKTCGDFVEGRVVTALGNSYHPRCFTCDRCKLA